jgi:hypothetical protein
LWLGGIELVASGFVKDPRALFYELSEPALKTLEKSAIDVWQAKQDVLHLEPGYLHKAKVQCTVLVQSSRDFYCDYGGNLQNIYMIAITFFYGWIEDA